MREPLRRTCVSDLYKIWKFRFSAWYLGFCHTSLWAWNTTKAAGSPKKSAEYYQITRCTHFIEWLQLFLNMKFFICNSCYERRWIFEASLTLFCILIFAGNRAKESSALEPNNAILEKLRMEMLKLSKYKQSTKACNIPKRPKISSTSEPVDEIQSAKTSANYAATHPDALSALRIDLW